MTNPNQTIYVRGSNPRGWLVGIIIGLFLFAISSLVISSIATEQTVSTAALRSTPAN